VDRVRNRVGAHKTALGWMPRFEDIDWSGIEISKAEFSQLNRIDARAWKQELALHKEWFSKMGEKLPDQLAQNHSLFELALID